MNFTNILSEEYHLGSILLDPDTNLMLLRGEGIDSEYFTTSDNKRTWAMAGTLHDTGRVHSIEMMEFEPDVLGSPGGRELAAHIGNIRRKCMGSSHIMQHIETLKGYKSLRMVYKASQDAIGMIEAGDEAEGVISHLQDSATDATMTLNRSKPWKTSEEIAKEMLDIIGKAQNPSSQVGFPTGIHMLDTQTGGLEPEQLWVIAAPSSCGKTMLMMQIAQSFLAGGKHVLGFSFETSAGKLGIRTASNAENICGNALLGKGGSRLNEGDQRGLKRHMGKMRDGGNLTVCDNFDLSLDSMMAVAAMRAKLGFPVDLIVVDYIQLVSLVSTKGKTREQEVAEISRGLKKMAKQHKCPVITASQLNDNGQTRESRAIVQDADVLLVIEPGEGVIQIAKNRDGERGAKLNLRMIGAYQRFEEYHNPKNH